MARKKKRNTGPPAAELCTRELSKGNIRSAVKLARAAYRIDASESNRSVLHRSLLGRVKELYGSGMTPQATAVLQELAGLGELSPDLQPEYARLQTLVGGWKPPAGAVEADPVMLRELAHEAVLRGANKGLPAEIASQASRIRESLEAVEAGKDELAQSLLQDIGRNSPLSDWKLLVRGLIALAHGDTDRVRGNWDRIREDSPARHIALSLLLANHLIQPGEAPPAARQTVANMNRRLASSFALDLRQAAAALADSDLDLDAFRKALRDVVNRHRSGPNRESAMKAKLLILNAAARAIYDNEMKELLREFPVSPAEDARLLATAAEDSEDGLAGAAHRRNFLTRLPGDPAYSAEEGRLARTLVNFELGDRCLQQSFDLAMIEFEESIKARKMDDLDSPEWLDFLQEIRNEKAAVAQQGIDYAREACESSPEFAPARFLLARARRSRGTRSVRAGIHAVHSRFSQRTEIVQRGHP